MDSQKDGKLDTTVALIIFGVVAIALVALGQHTHGKITRDGISISTPAAHTAEEKSQ